MLIQYHIKKRMEFSEPLKNRCSIVINDRSILSLYLWVIGKSMNEFRCCGSVLVPFMPIMLPFSLLLLLLLLLLFVLRTLSIIFATGWWNNNKACFWPCVIFLLSFLFLFFFSIFIHCMLIYIGWSVSTGHYRKMITEQIRPLLHYATGWNNTSGMAISFWYIEWLTYSSQFPDI